MEVQVISKGAVHHNSPSALLDTGWMEPIKNTLVLHDVRSLDGARVALTEAERIIERQKERIRQLEDMALTDELTGLLNRRGFTLALQRELSLARRDVNASGVLIMIDLDGFKSVNDLWGHSVGDDYLQAVAHALLGDVRSTDIVARLGGDEFVVMFTHMDEKTGSKRMAKLESSFNSRIMHLGENTLPLRASFGLSPYSGNDMPEIILAEADRKLYANKAKRQITCR